MCNSRIKARLWLSLEPESILSSGNEQVMPQIFSELFPSSKTESQQRTYSFFPRIA
ncbi:hypothetical protein RintRC_4743 [Richelia intracellularis]|nr:hypothetical protein RintRC_4743 [Richelia intracellularis]